MEGKEISGFYPFLKKKASSAVRISKYESFPNRLEAKFFLFFDISHHVRGCELILYQETLQMKENQLEDLIQFLEDFVQPSEEELTPFLALLSFHEIPKHTRLIRAGYVCERMYFVSNGFVKYVLSEEKHPKVIHIAGKGDLISDFFSYYSGMPAITDVYAITACHLLSVEKSGLEKLYQTHKIWEYFGRRVAEQAVVRQVMERIKIQTLSPEERYLDMINNKPDLLQVVKLGDLAQMLGISQETLSRIRKRLK